MRPFNKTTATLERPHLFSTLCTTPTGKMTLLKGHLQKHIQSVHEGPKFPCPHCVIVYSNQLGKLAFIHP